MLPPIHTDRSRRLLAVALLLAVLATTLAAQSPLRVRTADRLFPVPGNRLPGGASTHGFLGLWREGELARLTLYDDSLKQRAASLSFGLVPLDAVWEPSLGRAVLLAAPLDVPALFSIPVDAEPEPTLIWRGEEKPFRRIVASGDFDADGTVEVAAVGDSAFSIIGLDGAVRRRVGGHMLDAFPVSPAAAQFALLSRDGANVIVTLLDARSGTAQRRSVPLPGGVLSYYRHEESSTLALASVRPGVPAYLVDLANALEVREVRLRHTPYALVSCDVGARRCAAALVRSQEGPVVVPLEGDDRAIELEYPLETVFDGVATSGRFVALVAADSLAIYGAGWELVGTLPSPGTEEPALVELGQGSFLLSTASGSTRFVVSGERPSWIVRNWPYALGGLAILLAIGLVVAIAARYSLVQSIYFNLVGVPSSHGVIVLSRTQRVTQMNGSARELLGISSYIPLGRHISDYLTRDELRGVVAALRRLFIDGEAFETRFDLDAGAGARALTFRGRTMLTRAGLRAGYLLLVEDVTRTIAQERLVNWASVAHHIAHEMKTPLGTVRMTAEMLRERLSSNGRDEEYLRATARILKQSERLREIVDDLLTVARTESLQKTRADVSLLVASLAHDYRDYLPGNIDLEVVIQGEDHRCLIDVQQVTVALRNLLDNARHAIGGRDNGRINLFLTGREDMVELVVEDNGIGMRPETLARLFQPFYSEREGGSGIGTVIIKRVFEAHGGTVEVSSNHGVGTRFTVTIPRE